MGSESEEEFLVFAEFDENVNIEKYRTVHCIGVDSATPIIQMDDSFFAGKYESPLGTFLFFEEDQELQTDDPVFQKLPKKPLKYLHKTRKYLKMEHAYVSLKEGKENEVEGPNEPVEEPLQLVNFESLPEAVDHFRKIWNIPVETLAQEKQETEPVPHKQEPMDEDDAT